MFEDCFNLIELNISNFDTSNVTDMRGMFSNCESLPKLDLSSFNTCKTEKMIALCWGCKSLKELDLSNFNTFKLKDMSNMFCACKNLSKLDLSGWVMDEECEKETNFLMFSGCDSLTEEGLITDDPRIRNKFMLVKNRNRLTENKLNFNPADYQDEESSSVDNGVI
jgi:surface protein